MGNAYNWTTQYQSLKSLLRTIVWRSKRWSKSRGLKLLRALLILLLVSYWMRYSWQYCFAIWSVFDSLQCFIAQRLQKRNDWHVRQTDAIFEKLPLEFRPVDPPLPPYLKDSEEKVSLPCLSNGSICLDINENDVAVEDMKMIPVNISRVVSENMMGTWKRLFVSRSWPHICRKYNRWNNNIQLNVDWM